MWKEKKEARSSRKFIFLREERYQLQGLRNENYIEAHLKVSCLIGESDQVRYMVEMPVYKQTNEDGMYKWVGDLHELRERIVFSLNENGQIGVIHNISEIQLKWDEIKSKVFLRHKNEKYRNMLIKGIEKVLSNDDQLAGALRFVMPYLLLFPGIHSREYKKNEPVSGYRELPNFIATKNIPIITEETVSETENGKYQIDVIGEIDETKFEQQKVTAMLRLLKNRPRVPTIVELKYMERYLLDEWPWSSQSMCMSLAQIPGSLYREEKNILKMIKDEI